MHHNETILHIINKTLILLIINRNCFVYKSLINSAENENQNDFRVSKFVTVHLQVLIT